MAATKKKVAKKPDPEINPIVKILAQGYGLNVDKIRLRPKDGTTVWEVKLSCNGRTGEVDLEDNGKKPTPDAALNEFLKLANGYHEFTEPQEFYDMLCSTGDVSFGEGYWIYVAAEKAYSELLRLLNRGMYMNRLMEVYSRENYGN